MAIASISHSGFGGLLRGWRRGGAPLVQHLLDEAGLASHIQRCLSVDAVHRWKPAPEPCHYAAAELGIKPQRLTLVAPTPGTAPAPTTPGYAPAGSTGAANPGRPCSRPQTSPALTCPR